jgi:hypothetical protein
MLTGMPLILNSMLPDANSLALGVGLLASMLGMAAYAACSPFADRQDSLLTLPAQMQVTVTMVSGARVRCSPGQLPWPHARARTVIHSVRAAFHGRSRCACRCAVC